LHRAVQSFEVSLKAAIFRDGALLLVQEADTGYWELPGGRIDVGEEWTDHSIVLARELTEELGPALQIVSGAHVVTWVRQRPTDGVFQFIVARVCTYERGTPILSSEHAAMMWAGLSTASQLEFPPQSGYAEALPKLWRYAPK
jgi:8-oxo-dGTP diphosphatase